MKYGVFCCATLACSMTYAGTGDPNVVASACPLRQPRSVGVFGPVGDDGVIISRDALIDSLGNIFLTGNFDGFVDFDPTEGVHQFKALDQVFEAFLLKLNPDGSYAWAFVQEAPSGAGSVGISEDPQGNLVLATGRAAKPGVPRLSVAWITQSGVPFLTASFDFGDALGGATDIAIAPNGAVYVPGEFLGTVDFDPSNEVDWHASSGWDPFVTKLNADGSYAWTRTFGGSGADGTAGVASDPDGNVIITGTFRGSVDFDPGPGIDIHVQSPGTIEDSFVTKFYADGSYGWTRTYPLRWISGQGKPAVDRHGNIFFTDAFGGTVDFNPGGPGGEHTANGDLGDLIVVKLAPDGQLVWSFSTSDGEGTERGRAITIAPNDDVYVTGDFRHTSDFDPGPGRAVIATTFSTGSGFLLRLSPDGAFRSVMKLGEGGQTDPRHIGITARDEPVVIGRLHSDGIDFDPSCEEDLHGAPPAGSDSLFVVRYACIEPTADFSGDGFVEIKEFARMAWCLTGPGFAPVAQPLSAEARGDSGDDPPGPIICHPGCAIQDLDADGDIDLLDLALFANGFTGAP